MKRTLRPSLTLGLLAVAGTAFAQRGSTDQAYEALRSGTLYVQPGLTKLNLDKGRVESVANTVKPLELKVLVVKSLGGQWVRNGRERRGGLAKSINDQQLKLGDRGLIIVVTQKGISGYNSKLSLGRLDQLNAQASRAVGSNGDITSGVITLAQNINQEARTTTGTRRTGTTVPSGTSTTSIARESTNSSSIVTGLICLGIPALVGAALFAQNRRMKAKRLAAAREEANRGKDAATDAIAYVDSYDGLLSGPAADAVRQYRARMGESYEKGLSALNGTPDESGYGEAKRQFTQALTDFQASQKQIELATGGTGVAYRLPPVLDDAQSQRAPLLEPVKGVSFFSSEPSNDLVPVEVNLGGKLHTVMVTPAERAEFQAGRVPPIVGRQNGDRYQPWYEVDDYDPRRDYGRRGDLGYGNPYGMGGYGGGFGGYGMGYGGGLNGLLTGMAIGSIFSGGGMFGHGGYGYGGGYHGGDTTIVNNNYGDQGGGALGDNLGSGDFGSGGDFGGGGFDFGGGDSGGGGDFGGGGFDFGGGDSGGGDFGGGDSGGGGDW